MELSTREDIDAPIDWVWDRITDHVAFEKIALRRGADVQRQDRGTGFEPGATWLLQFRFRGKDRKIDAKITEVNAPSDWKARMTAGGIDGDLKVELVAMSKTRTRLIVEAQLSARTLSSRLMLQSMRLAKSGVLKRFRDRIASFASELETRYRDGV